MKSSFTLKHNVRKSFGKIPELVDMPNLLEIQKNSYDLFLQKDVKPEDIEDVGLQAVFNKVFPITDFSGIAELRFVKYELEDPRYDVDECIQRGGTYGSLLRVTLNLIVREVDEETGVSSVKDIKEQDVYLGDIGAKIQNHVEAEGFSVVQDFCGHGIGRTFHKEPNILHYGKKNTGPELQPGMTFTIEPMINAGKYEVKILNDGWTAVTKDKALSAQFEHTVGITDNGYEIFTESVKNLKRPPYN